MKKCLKCGEEKDIICFRLRTDTGKRRNICMDCQKKRTSELYHLNKEYIKMRNRKWSINNRDKQNAIYARYRKTQKREKAVERFKKKRSLDKYRMKREHMKTAMYRYMVGLVNSTKYEKYIDYTADDLRKHLESLWKDGMSWDNYGRAGSEERVWQLDHIIAQSKFDFSDDYQIRQCWRLNNIHPLWVDENLIKYNK